MEAILACLKEFMKKEFIRVALQILMISKHSLSLKSQHPILQIYKQMN